MLGEQQQGNATGNPGRQVVGLDLIRTAAAVMVMLFHLGYWIWTTAADPNAKMPSAYARLAPTLSAGWVGVEIFFVLSGFVIAYSTEGATPRRFARHRLYRLLPTALICATMTGAVLLSAYSLRSVTPLWVRSVSFWPVGPWIDGTYWTLPIEVAFYFFVFCTLFVKKGRYLGDATATLGVISATACVLASVFGPEIGPQAVSMVMSAGFPPVGCTLLLYGCFFSLGVFLFLSLLHGFTRARGAVLAICATGCLSELAMHARSLATGDPARTLRSLPMGIWFAAVGALVLSVKLNARMQEFLGARGVRVIRRMGIATYPLYLLHDKLGQVLIGGLHRRIGYGAALLAAMLLVSVSAVVVTEVLEPPLRRGLRSLLEGTAVRAR